MLQPIISARNLDHFYIEGERRRQVLFEIELAIYPGEFVIMTGPSGSGKSTLLSLIGCLRSVQSGSLRVLGQELNGASDRARTQARRNFGYIFQASNLLSFLTVEQNIATSLKLQGVRDRQTRRRKTAAILNSVGLLPQLQSYPRQLSGGQRQRAAIAGALVTQPELLLADEPTAALDSQTGRRTIELMHRLAKEQGSAVLMVTHDPRILDVADRIVQVEDGRLGLAYSQEISLALPGLKEERVKAMGITPDVLTYEPGAVVFREGDRAERFYLVVEGRVEAHHGSDTDRRVLATLDRGQYFGEIGLLDPDGRRSASIRVTDDAAAKLMVLSRQDFQRLMGESHLTELAIAQALQERVRRTMVTAALPELDLAIVNTVLPKIERLKYGAGSYIVNQGEVARFFYIVATGVVEAIAMDDPGRPQVISTLGPGDYFGEIGLLEARPRTVSVRAKPTGDVEVLAMSSDVFCELIEASQTTPETIVRTVYERLKRRPKGPKD